jgi:SAM-dependent methyltransferase
MSKLFSENEIWDLYQKHVNKPDDYYKKYEKLPFHLNDKNWKWEGKDYPRIWCVLEFKEWMEKHNLKHFNKVLSNQPAGYLSTNFSDPELEYITWDEIDFIPYSNGNNDFHTLDLVEKNYDFIIFNQTLEHLYDPFLSIERIYNHLKPGGFLFTSVPTINIPHMTPFHFNGFTPTGLCTLMKSVGFDIIELGFWGNVDYIKYIFEKGDWPDYRMLMRDGIITNERDKNAQCWILVKKEIL